MEQEQAVNLGKEERGGRQLFLRIHIFINVEEVFFLWQCLARGDVAQVLRLCYPERPVELAVLLCTFQSCAFWEAEVNAPPSHHPSLTFSPVRFYQHYQLHHHTYIHIKKHITVFFLVWLVLLLENLLASRSLGGSIGAHSWFSDFSGQRRAPLHYIRGCRLETKK